jgi:DNA-binding NarL/FixJ family response regulator
VPILRRQPGHRHPEQRADGPQAPAREQAAGDAVSPASGLPPRQPLTQLEVDTLQLIADGFTNREIAELLGVADETIKARMRMIFSKLGTRSRSHAVALGFRQGLLR